MKPTQSVMFTVDVEDWFQVENFKRCVPFSSWSSCELRVGDNTRRLLDLFDCSRCAAPDGNGNGPHATASPKATFFILGWVAKHLPGLVREIHDRGHEVASHGFHHRLCPDCSPQMLREDLGSSKKLLEDIIGAPVYGYRAPAFSISRQVAEVVEECGYIYDSSLNSFGGNCRYGKIDVCACPTGIGARISDKLYELPVSNLHFWNRVLPFGGGGYFRLMPIRMFLEGVRAILARQGAYLFYMHPWEIDPGQPRVREALLAARFKHYVNLHKTFPRIVKLLDAVSHCRLTSCFDYISALENNLRSV